MQKRPSRDLALCSAFALAFSSQAAPVAVLTQHNDLSRTGANRSETALNINNGQGHNISIESPNSSKTGLDRSLQSTA